MTAPRVLVVAPSAYTLSGLAAWLDVLLPGLARRGWTVTLGLVEGRHHHRPDVYLREHPFEETVTIRCTTGTPEGRVSAIARAVDRLRPDLVLSVNTPDTFTAIDRLRERGVPDTRGVMTVHGIEAFPYEDMHMSSGAIDAVVCTNRLAARLAALRGGIEPDRVLYAPYGVPATPVRNRRRGESPFRIAWVGRLEEWQKRIHDLPLIVERMVRQEKHAEIWIAGDGPERAVLERELETAGMSRVRLLGHIPSNRMAEDVYAKVDALLMTSRWETGPIVIWEAMAAGVPVVSSRYVGSGLEGALVHDENALLFEIGDAGAAATQLGRLMNEPGLAERLTEAASGLVERRYSVDASVDAWERALTAVMKLETRPFAGLPARLATGRLDALLGAGAGEAVRRVLQRGVAAADAGGEWPHSYSRLAADDVEFWELAESTDREVAEWVREDAMAR